MNSAVMNGGGARLRRRITLEQAVRGHRLWCASADFSQHTIDEYQNTFRYFLDFLDPLMLMDEVRVEDIEGFMREMKQRPVGFSGVAAQYATQGREKLRPRSPKTLANYRTGLASLWTWAVNHGYAAEHVVRQTRPPRVPKEPILPLTPDQVVALLRACDASRAWHNKPKVRNFRQTCERDRAMVALFVDAALRVSELADLRLGEVAFEGGGGMVTVRQGKGRKKRYVPFRRRCASFLHAWLMVREDGPPDDYLFVNVCRNKGLPMTRQSIGRLIRRLGQKAGLTVTPHRLRTTAACLMVQNGVTAWELQRIMGHSDVKTTMKYVRAAQVDLRQAMKTASPLDNLRL